MDPVVTLSLGGAIFAAAAIAGGVWQMTREKRRRQTRFKKRWHGDPVSLLEVAGPDERDVLRRIRASQGDEAAAIRLRRVDRDVPFDVLLAAVRALDTDEAPRR